MVRRVCMSELVPSESRLRFGKLSATDCLRVSWSPSSPVLLKAPWPVLKLLVPMLRVVEPRSDDVSLRGDMTPRPMRDEAAEASDSSTRLPGSSLPGADSEVGPSSGVEDNTTRCLLPLAAFWGSDSGSVNHQASASTSGMASEQVDSWARGVCGGGLVQFQPQGPCKLQPQCPAVPEGLAPAAFVLSLVANPAFSAA